MHTERVTFHNEQDALDACSLMEDEGFAAYIDEDGLTLVYNTVNEGANARID